MLGRLTTSLQLLLTHSTDPSKRPTATSTAQCQMTQPSDRLPVFNGGISTPTVSTIRRMLSSKGARGGDHSANSYVSSTAFSKSEA